LLLRLWCGLGLDGSDAAIRVFGVLASLSLVVAFWLGAWWLRRRPPVWSLIFVALNAWVIYYGAWLRAYGLGSAMIALCAGAAWAFLEKPQRKTWLLFAGATTLSVQTLYQNTALVAAICAGACVVCLRRKNLRAAAGVFLGGLAAALSLLPYWHILFGMPEVASPLRLDFDRVIAFNDFHTVIAYPLPQLFWVWCILLAWVCLRAVAGLFSTVADDRSLYAAVTIAVALAAFTAFLWLANFPVQPWYFLPLIAVMAAVLEGALPRLEGKFRAPLWGGAASLALISAVFAVRVLNCRFTNVDSLAMQANALAAEKDLVVVKPWQFGITFAHYFTNRCDWDTVPPMADHSAERFDLLLAQMKNTNAMQPLLERAGETLRTGHTVWLVGGCGDPGGSNAPAPPPPPPLPRTGWNETPYRFIWASQLGWFLHHHGAQIECVDPGTNENVNLLERLPLFKATGWRSP
ncbi:MAG TPA: hypothetical protein VF988_09885, partial [Verrucomicrobiae bacterium]